MIIYAGTEGYLDDVPVKEVQKWEAEFLAFVRDHKSGVRARLVKDKKLTDDILKDLKAVLTEFKQRYRPAAMAASPALAAVGDKAPAIEEGPGAARPTPPGSPSSPPPHERTNPGVRPHRWPRPERSSSAASRCRTSARSRGRWS